MMRAQEALDEDAAEVEVEDKASCNSVLEVEEHEAEDEAKREAEDGAAEVVDGVSLSPRIRVLV
jgi:hypothetical protein